MLAYSMLFYVSPAGLVIYTVKVRNGGWQQTYRSLMRKGVHCEMKSEGAGGKLLALGTHPSTPFEAPI